MPQRLLKLPKVEIILASILSTHEDYALCNLRDLLSIHFLYPKQLLTILKGASQTWDILELKTMEKL